MDQVKRRAVKQTKDLKIQKITENLNTIIYIKYSQKITETPFIQIFLCNFKTAMSDFYGAK